MDASYNGDGIGYKSDGASSNFDLTASSISLLMKELSVTADAVCRRCNDLLLGVLTGH